MSITRGLKHGFWRWALGLSLLLGGMESSSMARTNTRQGEEETSTRSRRPAQVAERDSKRLSAPKSTERATKKVKGSKARKRSGEARKTTVTAPLGSPVRFVIDGCETGLMTLVSVKGGPSVVLSARLLPEGCVEGATVALRAWKGWSTKPLPVEGKRTRLEVVELQGEQVLTRTRTRFFSLPLGMFRRPPREGLKFQLSVTLERGVEPEGVLALRRGLTPAKQALEGPVPPLRLVGAGLPSMSEPGVQEPHLRLVGGGLPVVYPRAVSRFSSRLGPVMPGQWLVIEL
ncbi:MAG: hypothetical protein ACKO6N_19470 [Myxococcota bacterium]